MSRTLIALILVISLALPALAQSPAEGSRSEKLSEVRRRVKMMLIWNIAELLKLDVETGAKVFPLLGKFEDQRSLLQREQKEIKRELKREAERVSPDEAKLSQLLDRFLNTSDKLQSIQKDQIEALRNVLTPTQLAKLMLYLPKFHYDIQQMIRKVKKEAKSLRLP